MAMYYSSVEHSHGLHVYGWEEEVVGQYDVFGVTSFSGEDWECSTNILANYAAPLPLPPPTSYSDVVLEDQYGRVDDSFEDTNSFAALYGIDVVTNNKNGSVQPPPPSPPMSHTDVSSPPQPQQPPCVGEEMVNELYMNVGWSDDLFTAPQLPVSAEDVADAEPLVNEMYKDIRSLDDLFIVPPTVSFPAKFPQPWPARSTTKTRRWTSEEHAQFLIGLKKYGKGDWISISRHCVKTKTAVQIASHAQKYYLRHANHRDAAPCKKKRKSIHDMTLQSITSSTYTSTAS